MVTVLQLNEVCYGIQPVPGISQFTALFTHWVTLSFIAIILAVGFDVLLYFLNHFLSRQSAIAEFKYGLNEKFITFALVLLTFWLVQSICALNPQFLVANANPSMAVGSGTNIFQVALEYTLMVRNLALETYKLLLPINTSIMKNYTIIWNQRPAGFGVVNQPLSGVSHILFVTSTVSSPLILAILSMGTLYLLLRYILIVMLPFIYPIGVFLRCMDATRKFGGMLMALAIGLTIGLPMMFTFNALLLGGYLDPAMNGLAANLQADSPIYSTTPATSPPTTSTPPPVRPFGNTYAQQIADSIPELGPQGTPVTTEQANAITSPSPIKIEPGTVAGVFMWLIFPIVQIIVTLFIAAILFPTLDFLLLVTFVKELSRFLGDEVDISKLTQLI